MGENGTLMENIVRWVILKGLPSSDLGVANIYAPNTPRKQCFLWAKMIQKFPKGCRWIVSYEIKGDCRVSNHCLILFCCRMGESNEQKTFE
jgi:hypothetical protein